jgi:hypothetical protein
MKLGREGLPSGGIDPVFSALFATAAILNLAPIALATYGAAPMLVGGLSAEFAFYILVHVLFIARSWLPAALFRVSAHASWSSSRRTGRARATRPQIHD